MKYCPKCGEKLEKDATFCSACGAKITETKKTTKKKEVKEEKKVAEDKKEKIVPEVKEEKVVEKQESEGLVIAALIIGVFTIVLSFILNIIIIPFAITGLVLGIVGKSKKGKKIAAIITNSVAIVLSIVMFILLVSIFTTIINSGDVDNPFEAFISALESKFTDDNIDGNWYCRIYREPQNSTDYTLTINLSKDGKFNWKDYKNPNRNYVSGTYTYKKTTDNTSSTSKGKSYLLTLNPENMVLYGRTQTNKQITKYKATVDKTVTPNKAKLTNERSHNVYYCVKK